MQPSGPTIEAVGLCKRYGDTTALDGLDLAVPAGTVCGLIGPNGAGKTTAVRILTTLLRPDGGRATVAGFDVTRHPTQVRASIGLVGQQTSVDEVLSGRQNLVMFGRLHHLSPGAAARRADELLEQFALGDTGAKSVADYSGGMRRRLDLAASLIRAPRVLSWTTHHRARPAGRTEVWSAVRDLVAAGTTLVLTTQYLEEVDQLADAIHLIDRGRVVAVGSPDELKAQVGGDRLDVVVAKADDLGAATVAARRRHRPKPRSPPTNGASASPPPTARPPSPPSSSPSAGPASPPTTSACAVRRSTRSSSASPAVPAPTTSTRRCRHDRHDHDPAVDADITPDTPAGGPSVRWPPPTP